ncbi:hypothetical protein [Labrys neptuniae]
MSAITHARKGNEDFSAFCERFGDDVGIDIMERMIDAAHAKDGRCGNIHVHDVHRHNACNHTYSGTVEHAGEIFGFIVHSGDWNGTDVEEWGPEDDVGTYDPPRPTTYTFVPANRTLKFDRPAMWQVYLQWRDQPWFKEKAHGYNYDRHFAPGGKTESHYRDWAASKGLRIVDTEEAQRIIEQPASEAPAISAQELQTAWEALP